LGAHGGTDATGRSYNGAVDLYRVQRLLGHRDGRMTQRYAHLAPENLREAVQVFKDDYHKISTGSVLNTHPIQLTA
jgi:integrase